MKKTYELVQVKVISLGNDDIIRTSGASRKESMLGFINLGELNIQDFS